MKIKMLSRSLDNHAPARLGDVAPVSRNLDPNLHPLEKAREYTRAVTAAKMDRMFAMPFIAALDGHVDGVYAMAKDPQRLGVVASGSGDGEIRLWNLNQQTCLARMPKAHKTIVQSLTFSPNSRALLSCSLDKTVKMWNADAEEEVSQPLNVFLGKSAFQSISHHRTQPVFATSSSSIQVWDETKSDPISSMSWDCESIQCVRFNQSETSVLASAGSDRAVILYDLRTGKPLHKMVMSMRANDIAWNPVEPTTFLVASEDQNLYTFDMRYMSSSTQILKDHVSAVMSCDWSPTGQECVSGSYDRTVRIWRKGEGRSRDVYHTKRMQRIFSTLYTLDARYVLTGSDDGNVRLWKARASEKLGVLDGREMASREYRNTLREKWGSMTEVRRLDRQRHVPKPIKGSQTLQRTMVEARRGKEENRRKHTRKGKEKPKAARKEAVLREEE